ncbi:MAG: hypothetical protein WAW13_00150 [Minisyncoccia bacterium]
MKKYVVPFLFLLFTLPFYTHAEEANVGFVQGLWYSSETVFSGVPTRIYVAFRNNTPHDLTGTVRFTDNEKRIGSSEISALSGRLVEAWIDWTPTAGEHNIAASVSDATLHIIGGGTQTIDVANMIATNSLTIDTDTDKDGTGNATDTDDDNDGVSDVDEKARGSDPLVKNPSAVTVEKSETEPVQKISKPTDETDAPNSERGLEQYVGEGTTDELLSNVTQKVETAKETIDTYREKRAEEIAPKEVKESTETPLGTYTDNATITRSKIETKNSFLSSFISGVALLLQKIWTFILWITSHALAYPALIELGILIGILYIIYRAARSVGRRPNN